MARIAVSSALATLCLLAGTPAGAQASAPTALSAEVARISKSLDGVVGVAAWRLDGTGLRLIVHGGERFPMASTFKVAVAGAVLARVDRGEITLGQMVAIPPDHMIESEVIADRFIHPGVSLSVENLLEVMLTQSDNTASDAMVTLAGGPQAVTAWVRRQGVTGLRVDRDTGGLLRDFFEIGAGPFPTALAKARQENPKLDDRGPHPSKRFDADPQDTSTPEAMASLLAAIYRGQALSPASTQTLIGMMERCRTGAARLRARLPAGTVVADKTGTLGGSVNDVGVVTLPDGLGQVVVVVFVKQSDRPFEERERVIADIGRSVRDFYLFQPRP